VLVDTDGFVINVNKLGGHFAGHYGLVHFCRLFVCHWVIPHRHSRWFISIFIYILYKKRKENRSIERKFEKKSSFWVWRTFFKKGHFKNVQKPKGPFKMKLFFFEKVVFLGDGLKTGG